MPNAVNVTGLNPGIPSALLPDTLVTFHHNTTQYSYASPAGTSNDVVVGFPAFVGQVRAAVTLAGGNAIWTGLQAGADGQHVFLWNIDTANSLTLSVANTGSIVANRFNGATGSYVLMPGFTILLVYYAGNVNAWVVR